MLSMILTLKVCLKKSIYAAFNTLIPKKPKAFDVKDFQPISLASRVYEIVTKQQIEKWEWRGSIPSLIMLSLRLDTFYTLFSLLPVIEGEVDW
jgi:hypothetical protein